MVDNDLVEVYPTTTTTVGEQIKFRLLNSNTQYEKNTRLVLEQGPAATEEAASLANRQFWRIDKIELRHHSRVLAAEQSQKP